MRFEKLRIQRTKENSVYALLSEQLQNLGQFQSQFPTRAAPTSKLNVASRALTGMIIRERTVPPPSSSFTNASLPQK